MRPQFYSWVGRSPGEWIDYPLHYIWASLMAQTEKNLPAMHVGVLGLNPGLGRSPGGGRSNPPQYCCLENSHGQRSLAAYSPCGHKDLDRTEWLSTAQQKLSSVLSSPLFLGSQLPQRAFRKGSKLLLSEWLSPHLGSLIRKTISPRT